MDKSRVKEIIAARAARELSAGDVVNLGIGLPTHITQYLPDSVHVILQSENGMLGTGPTPRPEDAQPRYITDAGGAPAMAAPGGCYMDSALSFALVRGGHVDATILGALEVDEQGNLANWIIPGVRMPGMGGAMDLVAGSKRVIVTMEHTAKGRPKILSLCTLPLTAVGCVDLIITEMGVMEVTERGLILREINPQYTAEQVQARTEARLCMPVDPSPMFL